MLLRSGTPGRGLCPPLRFLGEEAAAQGHDFARRRLAAQDLCAQLGFDVLEAGSTTCLDPDHVPTEVRCNGSRDGQDGGLRHGASKGGAETSAVVALDASRAAALLGVAQEATALSIVALGQDGVEAFAARAGRELLGARLGALFDALGSKLLCFGRATALLPEASPFGVEGHEDVSQCHLLTARSIAIFEEGEDGARIAAVFALRTIMGDDGVDAQLAQRLGTEGAPHASVGVVLRAPPRIEEALGGERSGEGRGVLAGAQALAFGFEEAVEVRVGAALELDRG